MSEALLSRIAALETELSQHRSRNTPTAIKQQLLMNPQGFYNAIGMTPDERIHLQRVTVAEVLGDQAPQDMKMYAAQGPQVAQMSQLTATLDALSRRVEELVVAARQAEAARESLKALIANKVEYPHFSAAVAANPALLDAKLKGRTGEAAVIAKELEEEAKQFATAYGYKAPAQPASDDAAKTEAQSLESKPAPLAGASMDAPPLPGAQTGPLTDEEDRRIQEELNRKYGLA